MNNNQTNNETKRPYIDFTVMKNPCSHIFRYLEKMRKDMPNKTSPSSEAIEHSTSAVSISKINNLFKPSSSTSTNKSSASSHYNSNSVGKSSTGKEVT